MSVTVHTLSPISPTSRSASEGYTLPRSGSGGLPGSVTVYTTASASATKKPIQQGAPVMPEPTGMGIFRMPNWNSTPTVQETAPGESSVSVCDPPQPQPSVVPTLVQAQPAKPSSQVCIPPPPKAGEVPKAASYYAPQRISPPAPASITTSIPSPPKLQQQPNIFIPLQAQTPLWLSSTPHDLSHPPGYVQDAEASFAERSIEQPYQAFSIFSRHGSIAATLSRHGSIASRRGTGGGILDSPPLRNGSAGFEDEKGLLDTAVFWAKVIKSKVIEGEEEVWKRIYGEQ